MLMWEKYCLDHLIRLKVFNILQRKIFNKTTNTKLSKFIKEHPYGYKALKYFLSSDFEFYN